MLYPAIQVYIYVLAAEVSADPACTRNVQGRFFICLTYCPTPRCWPIKGAQHNDTQNPLENPFAICQVAICSHLGRPNPKARNPQTQRQRYTLAPVAVELSRLLGADKFVGLSPDCIGPEAESAIRQLNNGQVQYCEQSVDRGRITACQRCFQRPSYPGYRWTCGPAIACHTNTSPCLCPTETTARRCCWRTCAFMQGRRPTTPNLHTSWRHWLTCMLGTPLLSCTGTRPASRWAHPGDTRRPFLL